MNELQFDKIWDILADAFTPELRRNYDEQRKLLSHPDYKLIPKYEGEQLMGFIGCWEFEDFVFLEHFAVNKEMRGNGVGSFMMKEWMASTDKALVLEVEKPSDLLNQKRIRFYERLGFVLNEYPYKQPPYQKSLEPVDLLVMSYPSALTPNQFRSIVKNLYIKVYQVDTQ